MMKDNKIVFFGTLYDNPDKHAADKVDIYDIAINTSLVGKLPFSIDKPSIISVNNTIYIAGGFVNASTTSTTTKYGNWNFKINFYETYN